MTQEALKLALEALEEANAEMEYLNDPKRFVSIRQERIMEKCRAAITAIKEALAQPEQEPVGEVIGTNEKYGFGQIRQTKTIQWRTDPLPVGTLLYTTPPQRTWVGLMRGARVEGDTVIISVKGGNEAARELCGALIKEMES